MSFIDSMTAFTRKASAYLQSKSLKAIVGAFIGVLSPLVILTTSIVVLRIGNFLPNETDLLFLVPKEPSFETSDGKTVWQDGSEIEVFKSEYVNGKNEVTVCSADGDGIIAPGTENSYTFNLKNNGNIALDYGAEVKFSLTVNGEDRSLEDFPLLIKLKRASDSYIIGSADEWTPIGEAVSASDKGTLGINSYFPYTLMIKWSFEGDDELDTALGSASAKENITLKLRIDTSATENPDPAAVGGLHSVNPPVEKIGGRIEPVPFALLLSLSVLSGALFAGAMILRSKK